MPSQLKLLNLALADFEAAGYVERQGVVTANLGITYRQLGLYRRARRLVLKADEIYRRIGALPNRVGASQRRSPKWNSRWGTSTAPARTSPKWPG